MSSEAKISTALCNGLRELGCYVWKANDARTVGIPDIVGVTKSGKHLAVETKLLKEWPKRESSGILRNHTITATQAIHLDEVEARGGLGFIAISFPLPVPAYWDWNEEIGKQLSGKLGCVLIEWDEWKLSADDSGGWPTNMKLGPFLALLRGEAKVPSGCGSMVCTGSMSSAFVPWDWGNL